MALTIKTIPARQGYRITRPAPYYYGATPAKTIVVRYPNTRRNFFYASAINSEGIQGQCQLTFDNREDAQRYLDYLIQADQLEVPNNWHVGTTNKAYECFKIKFRPFLNSTDEFEGWLSTEELNKINPEQLEGNIIPDGNRRFRFNEFYKVINLKPQEIDRLRYKIIQKIGTGHQPVIYRNGIFEIHNVQESEKGRILNILRSCDFISQTNVGSEKYDFGHFDFNSGRPQPKKLVNIRGMIKLQNETVDEDLNEAFEPYKAVAWLEGTRRENVARMSAQNVMAYSSYIKYRCQLNYNSREHIETLRDIKNRCLLPLVNRALALGDRQAVRCTSDNAEYVTRMIDNLEASSKNSRFKFNENNSSLKIEDSLEEDVEIHTELNPKLWDENNKLRPEVEQKIEEIVEKFVDILKEDEIEIKVEDIYVLGSNANYNYNDDSDLDVHIIADEKSLNCDKDHLPIIYQAYKTLFNNKYDITFRGINVEVYVENKDELSNVATGVYSLNDGWIKNPAKYQMPKIDNESINKKVTVWMNKFEQIKSNPTISDIEKYIDDIYDIRIKSLADEGEFGEDNLVFKEVRRNGALDELKELKTELESKELSLESLNEKFDMNILRDSRLGFGHVGIGDTFTAPEHSRYLTPGYLFTIVETSDGTGVTLDYDDPDFPRRFSGNLDIDVGYRFDTLDDLLIDLAKTGITYNDFVDEDFEESLNESKEIIQYKYDGPAFDYNDRDLGWFEELVSARSEKEALNRISFIIKRKLKMDPKHNVIHLEPSCLTQVEIQGILKNDFEHFICPNCGSTKNDQGECPLCDLGDESILDESLEPVLYHGTNIKNGLNILYDDELKLGKMYSPGVQQISFTRDLNAILKNYNFQIIFEVDRDKLHNNYKIKPTSDNKNCAGVKVPVYSRYTNGNQKAEEVVNTNIKPFKKYINKVLVKSDIYDKFMKYNDKYDLIDKSKIVKM